MALLPFLQSIGQKALVGAGQVQEKVESTEAGKAFGDLVRRRFEVSMKAGEELDNLQKDLAFGVFHGGRRPTEEERKSLTTVSLDVGGLTRGLGKVGTKTAQKLTQKYGKKIAQQITNKGGEELAQKALVRGGEEVVSHALKIDRAKVTLGKVAASIREAEPARKQTQRLFRKERSQRAARGSRALKDVPGERGFFAAKGTLRGELPKAKFEAVRGRFTQEEVDSLFDVAKNHPELDFFDKINVMSGLEKALGRRAGEIPQPNELKLMKQVYGSELVDAILSKRGLIKRIAEGVAEVFNVPRALMSSMDMSAPFRQGFVLSLHKPKRAVGAFNSMLRFFFDEKFFDASMGSIRKKQTFPLMKEAGLAIADVSGDAVGLSSKEEAFMTNLADKIPIIGRGVKASERAYTGFLNKLRADVFDDMAQEYIKGGIDIFDEPELMKGVAEFINVATGRGKLPGKLAEAAPLLNSVFYSPRYMASRIQMLNPYWYLKLPPPVRKEAVKSMIKFVGTGLTLVALAKLGGADVEDDPRSSDFGKIRFGNIRYDVWAGFQPWVRFTSQMILGERKSLATGEVAQLSTGEFGGRTRLSESGRFLSGKFAPVPSLAADLLRGTNFVGEDLSLPQSVATRLVPLYLHDIADGVKQAGPLGGAAVGIPAFFGVGTQAFDPSRDSGSVLPQLPQLPKLPSLPSF